MKNIIYVAVAAFGLAIGAANAQSASPAAHPSTAGQATSQPSSTDGGQPDTMAGGEGWG